MSISDTQNQPSLEELVKSDTSTSGLPEHSSSLGSSENKNTTSAEKPDSVLFSEQQPASDLISKAQSFLESPELEENDPDSKTKYLVTKGLHEETADELQNSLASIPVIPARTYPEALVSPPKSRLFENLVTLYYFFTYAAGASAVLTFAYSRFILPRWSRMIIAKHRLREHQLALLRRLNDNLSAHRDKGLTASSIALTTESKQPVLSTKLQELRAQVPDAPPKTTRQHALQSLSNLTGYLSSQYHITSGLDSAMRSYNFQFSMPGATSSTGKDDVQDQIKKDIRALKGLLINRRTFLQTPSIPRPASTQRMY
ncbi:hypothetical protein FRC12_007565 [Ceratobasidium sp. 428]|nr:hypothetical protein FRC12_007565 [Ceratobasidium sp. 428]